MDFYFMAESKSSFILYCDILHTVEKLPDEKAGQLFKHILRYVNDQNPETDDLIIDVTFEPIKQALKRDLKKWEGYIQKQRDNGAKGGRPKKPKPFEENPPQPKKADSVSVIVSDSVIDSVNVNKDSKLFEMFRRAASLRITDDMLLSEIGKFLNKYPQPEKQTPGLINSWCSRIELPKPKFVI